MLMLNAEAEWAYCVGIGRRGWKMVLNASSVRSRWRILGSRIGAEVVV